MTNEQIILSAKAKLIADGKIQQDEEIHTYKTWKKLGYQVFRGEKAVACVNIWKFFKSDKEGEEGEKQPEGKIRMNKAYFFSSKQVFSLECEA